MGGGVMYSYQRGKTLILIGQDDWLDVDQIVRIRRDHTNPRPSEAKAVITLKNDQMLITSDYTFERVWGNIEKAMQA